MYLQEGDWVRTETGEVGKIVHIYRLTAFVDFKGQMKDQDIKGVLLSTLTKVEPPKTKNEPPP